MKKKLSYLIFSIIQINWASSLSDLAWSLTCTSTKYYIPSTNHAGMSYFLFQLPTSRYLYSSWKNQGGDILQGWYKVKWEEGKGTCTSWRCWREEEAQRRPAAPLNLYVYNHCTLVYHQVLLLLLLLQTALALLYIVVKGKTWY